jgi:uncharacterized protein (TIGR02757 family)
MHDATTLKRTLDRLYRAYHSDYLRTDPLLFPRRYRRPDDREIVGFIAASLAYGRVDVMRRAIASVLEGLGDRPARFVARFDPVRDGARFGAFRYRFHTGRDIAALLHAIRRMLEEGGGSIEGFFAATDTADGATGGRGCVRGAGEPAPGGMAGRIERFSRRVLAFDHSASYPPGEPLPAAFRHFFPRPSGGSACKRLNLFLRWMVREDDGIDLGLWRSLDPARLVIPLDTHVGRISYALGLTGRRQPSWKAAEEVTAALAVLDPRDPVRYDFALCRIGILGDCPARRHARTCAPCGLRGLCRYPAAASRPRAARP